MAAKQADRLYTGRSSTGHGGFIYVADVYEFAIICSYIELAHRTGAISIDSRVCGRDA